MSENPLGPKSRDRRNLTGVRNQKVEIDKASAWSTGLRQLGLSAVPDPAHWSSNSRKSAETSLSFQGPIRRSWTCWNEDGSRKSQTLPILDFLDVRSMSSDRTEVIPESSTIWFRRFWHLDLRFGHLGSRVRQESSL